MRYCQMLLPDFFVRLPPAAALLVLCSIFQTTAAESLPLQTKTIDLRELHVLPWPPVETLAPRYPPVLHGLRLRQLNTVCGFLGGDPDLPATCSAGSHCAADVDHKAIGCCPNEGPCTQGVFTGCVDVKSGPQTEINPYIYTCQGDNVCYMNEFDGGYYQYGCGASPELATKVAATAPGQSALEIVSLAVALTANPTTLSEPTTIWTVTSKQSSSTRETTSSETSSSTTSTSSKATSTSRATSSETTSSETTASSSESETSKTETATSTDATTSSTAPADAAPVADESRTKNTGAIIGGTIGGVLGAVIIIALIAILLRRRRGNVREGPGPNQSSEFIRSPIDGANGHNFVPLATTQEVRQVEPPPILPVPYAHPGNRMQEYDNLVTSPYARDSDDYSQGSGIALGGVAAGSAGPRLEQDEIPLTRDVATFQAPASDPPALIPQPQTAQVIREEENTSYTPPQTSYIPRGDGGGPLWQQNRQTTRNPTWM